MRFLLIVTLFLSLSLHANLSLSADYNLVVQPVLSEANIKIAYQPLADYLSKKTGHHFQIQTHRDFVTYWERMKKNKGFDFVLDAAHFTDYRIQKNNYKVLAKLPDTVSFSVITHPDNFVFDMSELVSKRVATMPSPGLGAIRLYAMFPNPVRLPFYIAVDNSGEAAKKVLDGVVDAAIIPTPLVNSFDGVNTVVSTEPVPHMALSVASYVPNEVAEQVQQALLSAADTSDGQAMLAKMVMERFEPATNADYAGYASLLEEVFGY